MNKQQQIEENAKVIPEKIKDPLDNSRYIIFGKSLRREIARIYYNAGYRKVPDGAVVLLIGENNQALDEKTIEYFVKHNADVRKETAEKILQMFEVWEDKPYVSKEDFKRSIADLFGVEIKEYEK